MAARKKHFSYTLKDFYKEFVEKEKAEGKNLSDIMPYSKYKKIFEELFLGISSKIIYSNFIFSIPYGCGSVYIKSKKGSPKIAAIDYDKTKKAGKILRCLNRHTDGYYFRFWWNKEYVVFKNKSFYNFHVTKSNYAHKQGIGKKALSKQIFALAHDPEKRQYIKI